MKITIDVIKEANKKSGGKWFDRETIDFFSSRISKEVYDGPGGVYFVTSEKLSEHAWSYFLGGKTVDDLAYAEGAGAAIAMGLKIAMGASPKLPNRLYSVREFRWIDGSIRTKGVFQGYETSSEAHAAAKSASKGEN